MKYKIGDKVKCPDGCVGVVGGIDTHNGAIKYAVSFDGSFDFEFYEEEDLITHLKN